MTCPRFVFSPGGFSRGKPVASSVAVARLYLEPVDPGDNRIGVSPSLEGCLPSGFSPHACLSSSSLGRGRAYSSSRGLLASAKGGHRVRPRSSLPGVLRSALRRSQSLGRLAASPRLVRSQCVSSQVSVPYGDSSLRSGLAKVGRLGNFNRSYRRLLPHQDSQVLQEVAPFCVERSGLSVSGPAVRSLSRSLGVHPHCERALPVCSEQRHSHHYLDDWLILASSRSLCQAHTRLLLDVSDRLGFLINRRKSDLCPAQSFTYLGMVFDTVSFTVRPSLPRVLKLQSLLSSLLKKEFASARTLTSLLGMMESLSGLLPLGRLHKREFQRQLLLRWSQSSQGWDVLIPLSPWLLLSTTRWLDSEWFLIGVPIILPPPEVELFTDASAVGWGAHLDRLTTSGLWSANQALHHINWLELKAVCLALPVLVAQTSYRRVRLRTDNTTVACYVNKQGGARSPVLSRLAENLLLWCQNNNICLSALHVAGASNIIADQLSRPHLILQSEWTLVPQVLEPVWRIWFRPMVDLFATMFNHRLPVYVSPVPDPNAWRIDAFSCLWSGLLIYAFPPWSVLGRVLRKARVEKARLILIAPLWPAQAWYPDLLELSHVPPLRLQLRDRSLIQPRSGIPHGNVGLLNLHAWLLCGPNCSHGVLPLRR